MSGDRLEIALIRSERIADGRCPSCGERVAGWIAPDRSSASWAVYYERGRDPATGHLRICPEK